MDDSPTNLRDGRYAIVRLLGEGGQAATFEAVDKKEGQPVAIKRFRVRGAKSWKEVELAEREARVLSSLSHPGLPRYVEHFEEGGELFLVTERVMGESLAVLRKQGKPFAEADVIRFLRDASSILDYLHTQAPPVVHRDIKPSNVIQRPDGSFVLIDFGAVRDRMKPEGGSTVVGTFGYMAPEQFQGRAMPVSDVYAVGATALAMLTGREPEDLPHKGLGIDVASAIGRATNPALVRALEAMLLPDPDNRASRIAPLLEGIGSPSQTPPKGPSGSQSAKKPFSPSEEPKKDFESALEKAIEQGVEEAARLLEQGIEQGIEQFSEQWKNGSKAEKRARKAERKAEKRAERAEREARREERKVEKREERQERALHRDEAFRNRPPLPPPVAGIFLLGLMVAEIALMISMRVVVPIFLNVLSVFFGKPLRHAAVRVADAGVGAIAAIGRARDVVRAQASSPAKTGMRIEVPSEEPQKAAPPKTRFASDDGANDADDEDEALAEEEAREASEKQKKRR